MSCIDWHFEDTECPNCSNTFKVLWVEAGTTVPYDPVEIKTVGKDASCPKCEAEFKIDNINSARGGEITCN